MEIKASFMDKEIHSGLNYYNYVQQKKEKKILTMGRTDSRGTTKVTE